MDAVTQQSFQLLGKAWSHTVSFGADGRVLPPNVLPIQFGTILTEVPAGQKVSRCRGLRLARVNTSKPCEQLFLKSSVWPDWPKTGAPQTIPPERARTNRIHCEKMAWDRCLQRGKHFSISEACQDPTNGRRRQVEQTGKEDAHQRLSNRNRHLTPSIGNNEQTIWMRLNNGFKFFTTNVLQRAKVVTCRKRCSCKQLFILFQRTEADQLWWYPRSIRAACSCNRQSAKPPLRGPAKQSNRKIWHAFPA